MENTDCILRVKYSVIVNSESGKNKVLKKKTERSFNGYNPTDIRKKIDLLDKTLKGHNKISGSITQNGFLYSLKNFMKRWKHGYYEILNI